MNSTAQFRSFAEFYPYYLGEHSNPTCRRLHFVGTSLVIALLAYTIGSGKWLLLLAVPLTVDIEDGYSDSPEEVAELAAEVLRCGAVGINIEDGTAPSEILAEKIQAIRSRTGAAELFINARTDVYLRSLAQEGPEAIAMVKARAKDYANAGADGLFVPGLVQTADTEQIAAATRLPLNLMLLPGLPDTEKLGRAGMRRLSAGPAVFLSAYAQLEADTTAFMAGEGARIFSRALPFASVNALFAQ